MPLVLSSLLLFFALIALPAQAQGTVERVEVTAIDAAEYPFVQLHVRALDGAGRHVPGIERTALVIRDGESTPTAEFINDLQDGPLTVHFVIEAGTSLDDRGWAAAQEAVRHFARGGWMAAAETQVAVSVVQGAAVTTLVPYTTDASAIASLPAAGNPSAGTLTFAGRALTGLLDEMNRESPGGAKVVVFLTRQLEANVALDEAVDASLRHNIPIYTGLMRSSLRLDSQPIGGTPQPPPLDADVQQMAERSHGRFSLMGEDPAAMTDAYDDLTARRQHYVIAYRVSDSLSGTRNVSVGMPGAVGTVSGESSYVVTVEPPQVVFDTPDSGNIFRRQGATWDADPAAAEPATLPVSVIIGFGRQPLRRVRSVVLEVDGQEVDRAENLLRGDGEMFDVDLSWDLHSVATVGDSNHTLVVKVVDELGFGDQDSVDVTVRITMPPQPTPPPPPPPPVVEIVCITPEPFCSRIERPIRENPLAALSLLVALLALIFAAVIWATRGSAPVQRMTQTVRRGIDRLTNRYRRAEVRAYLEVVGGADDIGKRYEIFGDTPIGRSRQNAELLFQQEVENSPISRLHCTITDEEDHFMLRDEDSANGTYLNGERLTPIVPYRLKDGDIIELARVERGGVRLRFVGASREDTLPPDGHVAGADGAPLAQTTQVDPLRGRF